MRVENLRNILQPDASQATEEEVWRSIHKCPFLRRSGDEVFFTGTAVEVTPITSVDRIIVGNGEVGPVTKAIQQAFFGIVTGDLPDRHGWLTKVGRAVATPAES